jgi:hypothetical protein
MDALLSALVPGLGQLNQGRIAAAAHFGVDAAVLAVLMLAAPQARVFAFVALCGVTLWSMVDAYQSRPAS